MAWIPKDAEWYVADLVVEIRVEGDPRSVLHINTVLIHAQSPEEAHVAALELGQAEEISYENPQGMRVETRFRGIGELSVVHEPLEHGAELFFREQVDLSEEEIQAFLAPKEQLSVFQEVSPSEGPDYAAKDVLEEALQLVEKRASQSQTDASTSQTLSRKGAQREE